ncbi:MAG: Gmad2 immunoglobulin-like domain-containing protein [Candidatus Dormibacter sp.]
MRALPLTGLGSLTLGALTVLALASCGSSDQTQFVLQTSSASASASASGASPGASATTSNSPGSDTGATPTPIPGGSRIIIDSPDASTTITSPVEVSGTASVDKGTVVAVVLDAAGTELGRATVTASASAPDFGHYDVSVPFSGATSGTSGKLKVFGVSARDGKTPTFFYFITVRFP